jgi:hypothetical protein
MSGRFGSQLNGLRAGATAAGAAIPAAEAAIACYRLLSPAIAASRTPTRPCLQISTRKAKIFEVVEIGIGQRIYSVRQTCPIRLKNFD